MKYRKNISRSNIINIFPLLLLNLQMFLQFKVSYVFWYLRFLPKMAIFGVSGVPPLQFLGAFKAQIDPPGCSTHLGQLEVSMARMAIFGPKMGSK